MDESEIQAISEKHLMSENVSGIKSTSAVDYTQIEEYKLYGREIGRLAVTFCAVRSSWKHFLKGSITSPFKQALSQVELVCKESVLQLQ